MHELTDKTHWHEPGGTKKAGFGEFKKKPTPYDAFMEAEGIPVFRGIGISKVQNLPLTPWKRTGGRGHYIQLYGTETKWGCYVVEIPPAGALNPEKHMYEEIFLVVEGRGSTEVWIEGDKKKHVAEGTLADYDFSRTRIDASTAELADERAAVTELGLI